MSTALIVTADLGGNLPPMMRIGRELATRGWRVVVTAEDRLRTRIEREGFEHLPSAGMTYDAALDRSTLASLRDVPRFWADRVRGRDAVAAASRIGADVVVVDVLLVGALAELESASVATVVVAHSTWEGVRLWLGGPLGVLMRLHGVRPMHTVGRADRVLVASDGRLGARSAMPNNVRVIGPVLQEVPVPTGPSSERPLVLASLSTVAFPGQRDVLQRLLDAVGGMTIDVEAGTGSAVDPAGLRVAANTTLSRLVDHGSRMPAATAVVSHGGHATTVRALAHGLPILFVPMHPMMDQPRIARAVAEQGAGLVVPRSASPERIRRALRRLLDEPSFRIAAGRLGADFVSSDGARRAASEIEAVVGHVPA